MSIRDALIPVVDEIRVSVIDELAGLRLHTVQTRLRQWSGVDKGLGEFSDTLVTLDPRPRVRPAPQLAQGEAGRREAGDLTVEKISATYEEADLLPHGLSRSQEFCWLIDGKEYEVSGTPRPGFLGWTVALRRRGGRP